MKTNMMKMNYNEKNYRDTLNRLVLVTVCAAIGWTVVGAVLPAGGDDLRPSCPPGHTYEQEVDDNNHIIERCVPEGGGEPVSPQEAWENTGPLVPESPDLDNQPQTATTVYPAQGWCQNTGSGQSRPARAPSLWCIRLPDDGERTVYLWDEDNGRWQHVDTVLAKVERGTNINWYSDSGGRHRPEGTGQSYDIEDKVYRVKVVTRYHGTKLYDVRPGFNPVPVVEQPSRKRRSLPENAPPDTSPTTPAVTTATAPTVPTTATTSATVPTTAPPTTRPANPCDRAGAADHGSGCHVHEVPQCSPDGPTTYTYHRGGEDTQFTVGACPPVQDNCRVETTVQVARGKKGGVWTEAEAESVYDTGWDAGTRTTETRTSVKYVC